MKVPSIVLLAFILVVGQTGFAEKITFDYLYSIPRPSSPQVSPDGRHVAFVLTEKDAQAGTSESHLWLMDSDGDNLKKLTNGPGSESSPRWSPDGKQVAFESSRSGQSQIWLLPIDGGEASQVTSLSTGAGGVVWASTGDRFVFVSEVYGGCESDSCNRERAREAADRELQARLYDHLMFRHYNHWDEGTFDQIFVADLSTRTVRNLFPSRFNVPAAWLGGWPDYAVSPDGLEVCFAMSRDPNPALCVNNDLFTVGIRGGEATQITDLEGLESLPSYSPDGKYLCYRQAARAGYESDQNDLVVISREDGTHSNLTETFDYSVSEVVWGAQSRHIYFTAINAGRSCVYRVDVKWGKIETLLDDAVYGDLAISPDSRFLIVNRSLPDVPYELFRFDFKKETLGRLTFFTDDVAGRLDLSPAEDFWFPGFNGDSVHGFLTRPPYMESDRKYPMVLLIHGGPQWCWSSSLSCRS